MKRVLMPLPSRDFDPTETGAPWRVLVDGGVEVVFATPDGQPGQADPWMLEDGLTRLGPFAPVLIADASDPEIPVFLPTPARRRAFLQKLGLLRDSPNSDKPAFTVPHDGHYLSARWPGDAFTFARRFLALLNASAGPGGHP